MNLIKSLKDLNKLIYCSNNQKLKTPITIEYDENGVAYFLDKNGDGKLICSKDMLETIKNVKL